MTEQLLALNLENVLVYDIETAREHSELSTEDTRLFELFQYKNRNKLTGDLPSIEDTLELYKKTAALSPIYGKVVCISIAFVKNNTCYYKAITGEEKAILEEFYAVVNTNNFKLVGYNQLRFDGPFTRVRAFKCGSSIKPSSRINDSGRKPWELSSEIVDLMDALKGSFMNPFSLDEACYLFNVPSSKGDISGVDVSNVYHSEGVERIAKYCNEDVIATVKLLFAMVGKDFNSLTFVDKTADNKPRDLYQRIHSHQTLTNEAAEIYTKAKALKKAERPAFVELLKVACNKETFSAEEEQLIDKILTGKWPK